MTEFTGAKGAFLHQGKLLVYLRDNKPGLPFANMWDFPGGGREGEETPFECLARETMEEFGLTISDYQVMWQQEMPSLRDPSKLGQFFVIQLEDTQADGVVFGDEGQEWRFMDVDEFMDREDAILGLKERLQTYLDMLQ